MQIVRDLAGYSLGRSDLMRRAMAKKKRDVMAKEREYFIDGMTDEAGNVLIDGAVRRGVRREVAEKIFDEMSAFASYAFNKSHAAAYAMVAVQTGWLKRYHPVPFMAATLNSMMDNAPKVAGYIQYCRQNGIPVLKPDVNKSVWRFSVDRDERGVPGIRFGLGGVKNVGHGAVELVEKERRNGPFANLFDFVERVSGEALNKRTVESLIKAGAFDGLGHNRAQLLNVYERLMDDATQKRRQNVAGQLSLFDMGLDAGASSASLFDVPPMQEHPRKALLGMEREMTGVYISGHPLDEVAELLRTGFTTVADVREMAEGEEHGALYDGAQVSMAGILIQCKGKITKKGAMMGIVMLEDLTGQIEGLVFPKVYERYVPLLSTDSLVILDGKLSLREEEDPKLMVDSVRPLEPKNAVPRKVPSPVPRTPAAPVLTDAQLARQAARKLYVLVPGRAELEAVKSDCAAHPGDIPVYVKLRDEGIALLMSRERWCDGGEELLGTLRARYGQDAVVLRG